LPEEALMDVRSSQKIQALDLGTDHIGCRKKPSEQDILSQIKKFRHEKYERTRDSSNLIFS